MSSQRVHNLSPTSAGRSASPDDSTHAALQEATASLSQISLVINSLEKEVAADRCDYIMKRMEENRIKVSEITTNHHSLSVERRRNLSFMNGDNSINLLTKRQKDAIDMQIGVGMSFGSSFQEDEHASVILLGSGIAVKNSVRPINIPKVEKLPPYTTWTFMDRNQRMTEDQSVVCRRRIYYDRNGGETLICSDSEEEVNDEEEDKKEFVDAEDKIIRKTIEQVGSFDITWNLLAQRLSRNSSELKTRYEALVSRENATESFNSGDASFNMISFFDKDLEAAQDSLDNLFCRRCLKFDCKLHGCSQELIFPAEKQRTWNDMDEENVPCGPHCYLQVQKLEGNAKTSPIQLNTEQTTALSSDASGILVSRENSSGPSLRRLRSQKSGSASSKAKNVSESNKSHDEAPTNHSPSPHKNKHVRQCGTDQRNIKRNDNHVLTGMKKRQRNVASDSDSVASGSPGSSTRRRKDSLVLGDDQPLHVEVSDPEVKITGDLLTNSRGDTQKNKDFVNESTSRQNIREFSSWRTLEKDLFGKGLEMFGPNSCLIARNLLTGLKTCAEVYHALKHYEHNLSSQGNNSTKSLGDECGTDGNEKKDLAIRRQSRFLRRRSRVRRLKYTWKSAGYHSMRKRISDQKDIPCHQYNPCGCQSICGDDCSCLARETTCEKYCGCPKTCKIRFRGCHCAKSQCQSRQCPCFAANRDCDPDICKHCWISCGDGTLGTPGQKGDNYKCRNMKLLLKQQQRVLLGRSDVTGWGAFLKNSVPKNEYLGEYTGELISHHEADRRGKIYDRENSSFLFNLNDQYVLDAYRKGNKLKFANHSPNPNCHAKVIMVGGDHRVGIFANERILAGEELFYDYRYEADCAPAWAKHPEDSGSRKEHTASSSRQAKKLA